tara:strand:+ start:3738 stop:5576 length:1839 start_codon:yes stop_codon:yes gene_type:complete
MKNQLKILTLICLFNIYLSQVFKPENDSNLNYVQVFFNWPQIQCEYYELNIISDDTLQFQTNDNSILVENLNWGTNYQWKVAGYSEIGELVHIYDSLNFNTNELPEDYPENVNILVQDLNQYQPGINILDYESLGFSVGLDFNGEPIWYADKSSFNERIWATQFLENGNIVGFGPGIGFEFDINSNVVFNSPSQYAIHHHFYKPRDNSYFMLYADIRYNPCPSECPDNLPSMIPWMGDAILELDSLGNVIWEWSTFDYFSLNEYNPHWVERYVSQWNFGGSPNFDWTHSNSVFYDVNTNIVYLSARNLSRITAINYETKDIIWSIGDPNFMDQIYFDEDFGFSHQHSAQITQSGNLIFFDNGRDNVPELSRCVEVEFDNEQNPQLVWEYILPDSLLTLSRGECDRLKNGNTLITAGRTGNVLELGPDDEIVWHLNAKESNNLQVPIYRTDRVPNLYPNIFSFEVEEVKGFFDNYYVTSLQDSITLNLANRGWANQTYDCKIFDHDNQMFSNQQITINANEEVSTIIFLQDNIYDFNIEINAINRPNDLINMVIDIILLGDINNDGILNILDIVPLTLLILNDDDYNEIVDLNFDGGNNILDIIELIALIIEI